MKPGLNLTMTAVMLSHPVPSPIVSGGVGRCGGHRRSSRRSDLEVVGMLLEMLGVEADPKLQSLFQKRLDPPVFQSQVLEEQKVVPAQVLLVVAAAAESGLLGWAAGQEKPGSQSMGRAVLGLLRRFVEWKRAH